MAGAKTAAKGKKKGKGAKLSKAEKERLKKEELERKAQEEEEAKIRAEQEAKEREEREKQEREERRLLEEKERAQHQAEIDELNRSIEQNRTNLEKLHLKRKVKEKWDRYMLCDGRPDPTSKKELNTYMNLWREDTDFKPFQDVLQESELTLELISELDKYLVEYKELDATVKLDYKESMDEMHSLLDAKIDEAMMWLLKIPGDNINQETLNLQCVVKSKSFAACIWGNTAKNPRVKSVDFPDEGFTIEIPKSLTLADVSVRLLHKHYDNLSRQCSTFLPKVKISNEEESNLQQPEPEKSEKPAEDKPDINEDNQETQSTLLEPVAGKSGSRRQSRKSLSRASVASSKEPVAEKINEEITKGDAEAEENNAENEMKLFDDDEDLLDEDVVDLRSFAAMEPIMYVELFELPPQQQKGDPWILQQIVSSNLKRLNYGAQSVRLSKSFTESQYMEQQETRPIDSAKSTTSVPPSTPNVNANKPIAITLRAPERVIFFEDPQMVRWDEESSHWKLDGFIDVVYDAETRTISFKTTHFGPMAMIQDLYLNMPFQSWEVRPLSLNNCVISVIAATVDVEIQIKDSQCCLMKPDNYKEVDHLREKWMSPAELIKNVRKAGINIFPAEDGEKYVSICKKDPSLINCLYEQISLSSSAFAYCWSKWNSDCKDENIVVVGATEWCRNDQPTEDDYQLYMASSRICYKLATTEYDETFSKDIAKNTQMHPDLFHVVQDGSSNDAKDLVRKMDFEHVDCVYQLLQATNVMVYS